MSSKGAADLAGPEHDALPLLSQSQVLSLTIERRGGERPYLGGWIRRYA